MSKVIFSGVKYEKMENVATKDGLVLRGLFMELRCDIFCLREGGEGVMVGGLLA